MLTEHGMGILAVQLGAEHVVAICRTRIEDLARAMRRAGDPRTLAQLRADLAAEALLRDGYGPCPTHASDEHGPHDARSDDGPRADGAADGVDQDGDDEEDGEDGGVWGGQGPGCGCAPAAPPATAWIVVPFEVATGASERRLSCPGTAGSAPNTPAPSSPPPAQSGAGSPSTTSPGARCSWAPTGTGPPPR